MRIRRNVAAVKMPLALATALLLCACVSEPPQQSVTEEISQPFSQIQNQCEEPRPEICTREYRPVCGLTDTGIRCVTTPCDSTEWKTYSNACEACSNDKVFGYKTGEC